MLGLHRPVGALKVGVLAPRPEERRGLDVGRAEPVVGRDVGRDREVEAVRSLEGAVEEVVVGPVGLPLVVLVGEEQQRGPVASVQRREGSVEIRPVALVVEGHQDTGHRERAGELPVPDPERLRV